MGEAGWPLGASTRMPCCLVYALSGRERLEKCQQEALTPKQKEKLYIQLPLFPECMFASGMLFHTGPLEQFSKTRETRSGSCRH